MWFDVTLIRSHLPSKAREKKVERTIRIQAGNVFHAEEIVTAQLVKDRRNPGIQQWAKTRILSIIPSKRQNIYKRQL